MPGHGKGFANGECSPTSHKDTDVGQKRSIREKETLTGRGRGAKTLGMAGKEMEKRFYKLRDMRRFCTGIIDNRQPFALIPVWPGLLII